MTKTAITYSPTAGTPPDHAQEARARAWAFVFDCHSKKNAAGVTSTNGGDVKESESESRRKASIPKQ